MRASDVLLRNISLILVGAVPIAATACGGIVRIDGGGAGGADGSRLGERGPGKTAPGGEVVPQGGYTGVGGHPVGPGVGGAPGGAGGGFEIPPQHLPDMPPQTGEACVGGGDGEGPCCREVACMPALGGRCPAADTQAPGGEHAIYAAAGYTSLGTGTCVCGALKGPYNAQSSVPAPEDDKPCCYVLHTNWCTGRPLLVNGAARLAELQPRSDWRMFEQPIFADAPEDLAEQLADAWLNDARYEHASIASFARFTLQLMSLGAPPALVLESQQAGLDEVRHAQACFTIASHYAGLDLGPGAIDVEGALSVASDLTSVAVASMREGCVGETLAAMEAAHAAAHASDATVRRVLSMIYEDESRHAALSWKVVRWAIDIGGEAVREAVLQAFDEELLKLHDPRPVDSRSADQQAAWLAAGRLPHASRRQVRQELVELILKPARGLIAGAFGDNEAASTPSPQSAPVESVRA